MVFTRRERMIIVITVITIILLVADKYCLSPILDQCSLAKQNTEKIKTELQQSLLAIERKNALQKQWDQMKEAGLTDNYEQMESNVLRYIKDSSFKNNLTLSSVQPNRVSVSHDIEETEFTVSGSGSIDSVTKFLWDLETAKLPVKIRTLQLGANDETADQMSLQVKLASICINTRDKKRTGE